MRCSICKKIGLEEDFIYPPTDEKYEVPVCFDCADPEMLRLEWDENVQPTGDENADDGTDAER
jgi:hypothetical protein